eukprot:gene304-306_t
MKKQKVACITYTEVAANEIREDVNVEALVHVSTIHSFYWTIVSGFQADIKVWLKAELQRRIDELVAKANNFGARVRQNTRDNNKLDQERFTRHLEQIEGVTSFRYGMGSDYPKGILGHEDIIQLADHLLKTRPLFRQLVALKYPFIFIDESQDTFKEVFLECPAPQLTAYGRYVSEGSPFATQHGVKGAQFDRVLVVMDEEENDYRLYDYEKVLGDAQASIADRAAFANGEDNTWSRTLRLLYVCCTRAKRGLALVFFVADPALIALLVELEADGPTILVIDMVEHGLDTPTQQALSAYLRRRMVLMAMD